jgi:hypothetical protein
MAWVCRTGPPAYVAWRAGTTTQCQSRLYPHSQGLRIWPQDQIHAWQVIHDRAHDPIPIASRKRHQEEKLRP